MLTFNLALTVTLISLAGVCANPAERKDGYDKENQILKFYLTNAVNGNEYYKLADKSYAVFELLGGKEGSYEQKLLAKAEPGKTAYVAIKADEFKYLIFLVRGLFADSYQTKQPIAIRLLEGVQSVETVLYRYSRGKFGYGYDYYTNVLKKKDDKPLFKVEKGYDCEAGY